MNLSVNAWRKAIPTVVSLVTAVCVIVTLLLDTRQRARDLRWRQAELARNLLREMLQDTLAREAMKMVDWDGRTFRVDRAAVQISQAGVLHALDTAVTQLSSSDIFVRDAFDRLFFHFADLDRALTSGLIEADDVRSTIQFYVRPRLLRDRHVNDYMALYGFDDAVDLIGKFAGNPQ